MRVAAWILLLLAFALLTTAIFPPLLPAALRPDLFALLILFLALRGRRDHFLQLCWLIGLFKDILSGAHLGATALLYLFAALALLRLRRFLNTHTIRARILLAFGVAFFPEAVLVAPGLVHLPLAGALVALKPLLFSALLTAALTPVVFLLLEPLRGPLGQRRRVVFGIR